MDNIVDMLFLFVYNVFIETKQCYLKEKVMGTVEDYKQKLTDHLADEYSYSKHYGDFACMQLIEDLFLKMELDKSVLNLINS